MQQLLQNTQNTEREARKDLSHASEELAALRATHAREIDELERTVARKDREKRNIEEELRDRADEATRDREAIRELKVCRIEKNLAPRLTDSNRLQRSRRST